MQIFWVLIVFIVFSSLIVFSFFLEKKYTAPYTLAQASAGQKWKWAAILAFPQMLFFLCIVILFFTMYDSPEEKLGVVQTCGGLWVVICVLAILNKRWALDKSLKEYQKMDKAIKRGGFQQLASLPIAGWMFRTMALFSTSEQKQFLMEGYQDTKAQPEVLPLNESTIRSKNNRSIRKCFSSKFPNEQILYTSPATFKIRSRTKWIQKINIRRGEAIFSDGILFFKSRLSLRIIIGSSLGILFSIAIFATFVYLFFYFAKNTQISYFLTGIVLFMFLFPLTISLLSMLTFCLLMIQNRPFEFAIHYSDISHIEIAATYKKWYNDFTLTLTSTSNNDTILGFTRSIPEDIIQKIKPDNT